MKKFGLSMLLLVTMIWPMASQAANSTPATNDSFLKVFYFKDNTEARTSLYENYKKIDVLAPQAYSVDEAGDLAGGIDPNLSIFIKLKKMKVMPLVTNKGFNETTANTILDDKKKQDRLIKSMIAEAKDQGFWGWQIDFEGMDADYRDKFSAFIKRIGEAMKKNGLVFSVAVIAQISDKPADYPNDLWNRVIGAFDYAALAPSVDFISIMSYDDPMSKGPTTRYGWLKLVLDYSVKHIPANKLSLGIPLYYWKWNDTTSKLVSIGGNSGIQLALKKKNITTGYDTVHESAYIKYTEKKNKYTVWYANGRSVTKLIDLAKKYQLHGFSAWALGQEVPSVFKSLK